MEDEFEQQQSITSAVMTMCLPTLNDYHKWLKDNSFNVDMPNPTNNFAESYETIMDYRFIARDSRKKRE